MLTEFYLVIVFLSPGPVIHSYVKAEPFATQVMCAEYAQTELFNDIESFNPEHGAVMNVGCVPLEQETI